MKCMIYICMDFTPPPQMDIKNNWVSMNFETFERIQVCEFNFYKYVYLTE